MTTFPARHEAVARPCAGPGLLLAVHAVCWALYGAVTHWGGVVHTDMLEAWSWGREWQPGYYKHPPVFAWVAGAWFAVVPRGNLGFYALSSLNSAVGLVGVWRICRLFDGAADARLGVALLTLTPLPNILALTFNANSVLLSVWPWTAFAFLRSLRTGSARDGALFGAACAVALLAKYYSAVLVLACLGAALAAPGRRRYFAGPAPWAAIATCTVLCCPYLVWSAATGFGAVDYALSKTVAPRSVTLGRAPLALAGSLAYLAGAAALLALARPRLRRAPPDPLDRPLLWLALAPLALTLGAALVGNVNLSTRYLLPAFFAWPALAVARLVPDERGRARIARAAFLVPVAALAVSPLVAAILFRNGAATLREPRRALAAAATELVRHETGRPLAIVGGTVDEALAIAFYSPDAPSDFTSLDAGQAPWITPERLARDAVLVVCGEGDAACLRTGAALERAGVRPVTVTAAPGLWGLAAPPRTFRLFVVRPPLSASLPWSELSLSHPLPVLPKGRNPDISLR